MTRKNNTKFAIGTFFLHVLAGPPIGGILFISIAAALKSVSHGAITFFSMKELWFLVIPFSYLMGGIPSILTGSVLAVIIFKQGFYSYKIAMLVPVSICFAILAFDFIARLFSFSILEGVWQWLILYCLPSLGAALVCRFILSSYMK